MKIAFSLLSALFLLPLSAQSSEAVPKDPPKPPQAVPQKVEGWPGFRGASHSGVSPYTNIPTSFDLSTGRNVCWKAAVPEGISSPVVWGDKVFVSGSDGKTDALCCMDAVTGKEVWKQSLAVTGDVPQVDESASFAAPTPATDGQRIYAVFASGNLVALDFTGKLLWSKQLGPVNTGYGYASSPVVVGNLLVLQLDLGDEAQSHMLALDGATGKEVWRKARAINSSWTTPAVVRDGACDLIVTAATPQTIAYDARDGAVLWKTDGLAQDSAPSPICAGGFAFVVQYSGALAAVPLDGKGDVTPAWTADCSAPTICTPVSNGERMFLLAPSGTLQCFNVKDGKKLWDRELEMSCYSSPSLVGDHLFLFSHGESSAMLVVPAKKDDKPPLRSELKEACSACPAFQNGRMYIRGRKTLYCIGETPGNAK